mmetsp:Transcript_5973/g.14264  ORF Transcript_5973/g.14264 Transcript_5973/m.14264 type:complete len:115 (+) Transcript_5973:233-577(+)
MPPKRTKEPVAAETTDDDIKHKKSLKEQLDAQNKKQGFRDWLKLKLMQYNVTSALYMLDWWERLLFNIFIASIVLGTLFAMYVYSHTSLPLFILSIILLALLILLILLCPLHQY